MLSRVNWRNSERINYSEKASGIHGSIQSETKPSLVNKLKDGQFCKPLETDGGTHKYLNEVTFVTYRSLSLSLSLSLTHTPPPIPTHPHPPTHPHTQYTHTPTHAHTHTHTLRPWAVHPNYFCQNRRGSSL